MAAALQRSPHAPREVCCGVAVLFCFVVGVFRPANPAGTAIYDGGHRSRYDGGWVAGCAVAFTDLLAVLRNHKGSFHTLRNTEVWYPDERWNYAS